MASQGIIRRLTQSHPQMAASFLGLMLVASMVFCAEVIFFIHDSPKNRHRVWEWTDGAGKTTRDEPTEQDDWLGYTPLANARGTSTYKLDGELVYRATYSIDEHRRRITPVENPERRTNFIFFFGCSFAFGEGVNDAETLPFYVGQFAPTYRPYNYGVIGYGTQGMLAQLQSGRIPRQVAGTRGTAVYVFIDHHVERVIGRMRVHNRWARLLPFYTLDSDGRVMRNGSLSTGRPLISLIYRVIDMSSIASHYNIDIPVQINGDHLKLTERIIEESRNIFRDQFHSDEFYVLFYPGERRAKQMIRYLRPAGIKYLDYSHLLDESKEVFTIANDSHPTALAYKTIAARLVQDLGIGHVDRDTGLTSE